MTMSNTTPMRIEFAQYRRKLHLHLPLDDLSCW
jgi:hypothetical protein